MLELKTIILLFTTKMLECRSSPYSDAGRIFSLFIGISCYTFVYASFWDNDTIPVYNTDNPQSYSFSGKRIQRGLFRTADGTLLNADINGALNIMKKVALCT
ncbi:MAG: hypothetical protein K2H19_06205 [Ruminococcus sp.]|nr:hypothetical protein [Ruminococcus sp.]